MPPTLEEACALLLRNEDPLVFQAAIETLFKICQKIVQHPDDAKFRSISRSGASFTQKLSSAKGAVRFLKALGFEEEGGSDATSSLVLPAAAASAERLAAGKAALKAVLKQHTEMWTRKADEERRKENEASVQKLADLRAVSKRNSAKRDAEDEQLRRQLVAGISADKAEDQKWRTEYDAMGLPGNKPVS